MKRMLALALPLVLPACGALFNSGPAHVSFNSNPVGAEVLIDGQARGTTPLTLDLAKNKNYTVVMRKPGFGDASANLVHHVGGGWVILDILGGIFPVVIDAATGSWYSLSSKDVVLNLPPQSAMHGQLTPEQLAAVRLGVSIDRVLTAAEVQQ